MGATTANDVTAPELDTLCRRIAKRSPTTAINVYKLIRAAFRWGFKKDLVERDVSAKLDRPAEERRLPTEERTLNDLRATCATGARRMSGLPHVPALVLGHQGAPGVPDVTSRYDRADTVPEVAKGLNAWAAYIESLVTQEPPLPATAWR